MICNELDISIEQRNIEIAALVLKFLGLEEDSAHLLAML